MISAKEVVELHKKAVNKTNETRKFINNEKRKIEESIKEVIGETNIVHYYSGASNFFNYDDIAKVIRDDLVELGYKAYIINLNKEERSYKLFIEWRL